MFFILCVFSIPEAPWPLQNIHQLNIGYCIDFESGKTFASFADKPNRGETQLVIPFSGKGYVLGERSNSPSSGKFVTPYTINKTQDLLGQDHSAKALRPNTKIEVKFEHSGSNKKTLVSPVLITSHQNVLSNYFPTVSVAGQKAFRSVSGSPTKSLTVGDIPKNSVSSGSQRRGTSSKIPLRNSLKAPESTSVTASLDVSGSEEKFPSKRPRLEDKTVFDKFFIKKEEVQSSGNDPEWRSHPTAATPSPSSPASCLRMVDCPVCQNEVLESQINEHLDWCLEGDSIKVKSWRALKNQWVPHTHLCYPANIASVAQESLGSVEIHGLWASSVSHAHVWDCNGKYSVGRCCIFHSCLAYPVVEFVLLVHMHNF